jgi:hypothetical protein
MSNALLRWQQLLGFSDDQAALHLGLSVGEFARQRAARPSRQTCLIAILVQLYKPDLTKIGAALADLARPPGRKKTPPICRATGRDADRPGGNHGDRRARARRRRRCPDLSLNPRPWAKATGADAAAIRPCRDVSAAPPDQIRPMRCVALGGGGPSPPRPADTERHRSTGQALSVISREHFAQPPRYGAARNRNGQFRAMPRN